MKSILSKNKGTHTTFVRLNTESCTACWECLNACPGKVLDKSFLYIAGTLIFENVLIYNESKCSGCLNCINACKFNAISIIGQ